MLLDPASLRPLAANAAAATLLGAATGSRRSLDRAWGGLLLDPVAGHALADWLPGQDAVPHAIRLPGSAGGLLELRRRRVTLARHDLISVALLEPAGRDALSLARRRLDVALASAELGAWHWDTRTGLVEVTDRWATMLGLPPPEGPLTVTDWLALLHPEDRAPTRAIVDRHLAADLGPYEAEFRMRHVDGHWVPVLARGAVIERDAEGRAAVLTGTHLDLTATRRVETRLLEAEREARARLAELEQLYALAPLGLGQLDSQLRFVRINEALADMNGVPVEAHLGRRAWDLVPDLRAATEPLLRRVLEQGEPITGVAVSGETPKAPGVARDWVEQFYPLRDPESGRITGIGIVCEEVTERRRAERTRDLLIRELDHRVKNMFAVIDGLVAFTARGAASPTAMHDALHGRIQALAHAHDVLRPAMTEAQAGRAEAPQGAQLGALLRRLLAPFRGTGGTERVQLAGPRVPLGLVAAPPIALAFHELATNAGKYGALSRPEGSVAVRWRIEGERLRLLWREEGGPAAVAPKGRGFGLRLVTQSAAQLGGTAEFCWSPDGLAVELVLPLARLAGD